MKTSFHLSLLALGIVHVHSYFIETENSFTFGITGAMNENSTVFYAEWKYNAQMKEIVFNVSCKAFLIGWCALGISLNNKNMTNLDIFLVNSTNENITVRFNYVYFILRVIFILL